MDVTYSQLVLVTGTTDNIGQRSAKRQVVLTANLDIGNYALENHFWYDHLTGLVNKM